MNGGRADLVLADELQDFAGEPSPWSEIVFRGGVVSLSESLRARATYRPSPPLFTSTVDPAVVARRRAKNKAARRTRRVNRGRS